MSGIELGPIRLDEAPQLLRLLDENHLPREGLMLHLSTTLVARNAAGVIASAALEVHGDAALLRSVAVASPHRGAGLGIRITRAAMEWAQRLGVTRVFLLTETAEAFFAKQGFRKVARDAAPESIRGSVEFAAACPASAVAMEREP